MRALRIAVALSVSASVSALAFTPALARMEAGAFDRTIAATSPQGLAVAAVLDALPKPVGIIETTVLDGVRAFYAARADAPAWVVAGNPSPAAIALRAAMDRAGEDGLDPALYAAPITPAPGSDSDAIAAGDIAFSLAVARYVTHLQSGHLVPIEVSDLITLEPERPDGAAALATLASATDIPAALAAFEPPHPQYAALKGALATLRAQPDDSERVTVPEGKLLKPGMSDARVVLLRRRLAIPLTEGAAEDLYGDDLVAAVKTAQAEAGLNDDGILGPRTLVLLNGQSRDAKISTVIANMERWRWMPRDLGAFHVFVNVPEFMVRVVKDGATVHETRVVVGASDTRTPIFSHRMSHIVVNPYWNVPSSIVTKEMMPAIRANPRGYFSRRGYEVFVRVGGRMRQVDPAWVDWYGINPRVIQIRQIPGEANALGRIKFMFPNQHSVYLHDTPSKSFFQRDERALSHGCVRVDNPLAFADAILPVAAPEWSGARLESLYGGKERWVKFDTEIPVHLAYFTASVAPDGTLQTFGDVYGYDAAMTPERAT